MKLRNQLTRHRADTRYVQRAYSLVEGFDNDTDYVVLGRMADFSVFHLQYQLELIVSGRAHCGEMTVMHDGGSAWIAAHEYDHNGTEISGLTWDADISGDAVRLVLTKAGVGENTRFHYKVGRSAIGPSEHTVKYTTASDLNIYVDSVNGDDEGDGSSSSPYRTFAFMERLPREIRHEIKIKPKAGTYTGWPSYVGHRYVDGGRLVIDASSEPYPVLAGPFTISTVTNVAPPDSITSKIAVDLQVSGSPGWSNDQHYGIFIHVLTGNWAGKILPVWKNDTDTLRTFNDWLVFSPGDTFNIVDCPVTIQSERMVVEGERIYDVLWYSEEPSGASDLSPWGLEFLAAGVKFETSSGSRPIVFKSIAAYMPFCSLVGEDDDLTLELYNAELNWAGLLELVFDNADLNNIFSLCLNVLPVNGAVPTGEHNNIVLRNSKIGYFIVRGGIKFWSSDENDIYGALCGGISADYSNGLNSITSTLIEQIGYSATAILAAGHLKIYSCFVEAASKAARISGRCTVNYLRGNNISSEYAVRVEDASHVVNRGGTSVDIAGTEGAIEFPFSGTNHATWPAPGVAYTDNGGSYVITKE